MKGLSSPNRSTATGTDTKKLRITSTIEVAEFYSCTKESLITSLTDLNGLASRSSIMYSALFIPIPYILMFKRKRVKKP
jgi:hypothetical protein